MSYRVAAASIDGKVINQHFGRASQFLIFDIDGKAFNFVETRENAPPCSLGDHHEDAMGKAVQMLSDCTIVLVSKIGSGAVQALGERGIQSYEIRDFIDKALEKLVSSLGKGYLKS